jgi:hypothetical protein
MNMNPSAPEGLTQKSIVVDVKRRTIVTSRQIDRHLSPSRSFHRQVRASRGWDSERRCGRRGGCVIRLSSEFSGQEEAVNADGVQAALLMGVGAKVIDRVFWWLRETPSYQGGDGSVSYGGSVPVSGGCHVRYKLQLRSR